MQLVIPCRPESAMIMVMVMMLMRIGVIVEQCSWLSPADQNLPVIAAAVSACTPVSNQPRFFTTVMIMKIMMIMMIMMIIDDDHGDHDANDDASWWH